MTPKQQAIEMLGGSQTAAAKALGITYQAVRKWPESLTPDIENRLIGMLVRSRRKVPNWLVSAKPQAPQKETA